jgi:hypothetical protein
MTEQKFGYSQAATIQAWREEAYRQHLVERSEVAIFRAVRKAGMWMVGPIHREDSYERWEDGADGPHLVPALETRAQMVTVRMWVLANDD